MKKMGIEALEIIDRIYGLPEDQQQGVFDYILNREYPGLVKAVQKGRILLKSIKSPMVPCPKCGGLANYEPYFGRYICRSCGWDEEGRPE